MANLPESSTFDAGVYQIETTDPVIGGPSGVTNTPLKNLANRTKYLKDQVDSLETNKAPLASPAFTGTPTVPTAAAGTNTTQAASTAFVKTAVAAAAPDLSPYATKASPTFTGNPVAPTPAQFDNDTSLATTAFVQRAIGGFGRMFGYSTAGQTIPASQANSHINIYGSCSSITLPAASSVAAGSVFVFDGIALTCSINRQGSDTFYLNASLNNLTSIDVKNGSNLTFVSDGGSSWFVSGVSALKYADEFQSYLASSGYQKLPSGLIIQWGVIATSSSGSVTGTYPIAFPNNSFQIIGSSSVAGEQAVLIYKMTNSTFGAKTSSLSGVAANGSISWVAIGY